MASSPDGSKLFTGSKDGKVRVRDMHNFDVLQDIQAHNQEILNFTQFGQYLVVGTNWDNLSIWDSETGKIYGRIRCDGQIIHVYHY